MTRRAAKNCSPSRELVESPREPLPPSDHSDQARQPDAVDATAAMNCKFYEERDLKKEQRLLRELREGRARKMAALLDLAENTVREERSGIDEHGRRFEAPTRPYWEEAEAEKRKRQQLERAQRAKEASERAAMCDEDVLEEPATAPAPAPAWVPEALVAPRGALLVPGRDGSVLEVSLDIPIDASGGLSPTQRDAALRPHLYSASALEALALPVGVEETLIAGRREPEEPEAVEKWTGRRLTRREALDLRRASSPDRLSVEERRQNTRLASLEAIRDQETQEEQEAHRAALGHALRHANITQGSALSRRAQVGRMSGKGLRDAERAKNQVRGRPRLAPEREGEEGLDDEFGPFRMDRVDLDERIAVLLESSDLKGVRAVRTRPSGAKRADRAIFAGSGVVVARGALAAAKVAHSVQLPGGKEHRELRERLQRLRSAQAAQFGVEVPAAALPEDGDETFDPHADRAAAQKEIDALLRGLAQHEHAKARETGRKLGRLRRQTLALGTNAEQVADVREEAWEREQVRREEARRKHENLVAAATARKAQATQKGRRDERVKRERKEARLKKRQLLTGWLEAIVLATRTEKLRRGLKVVQAVRNEREQRRATILLRIRFRKFLPAWRAWAAAKKVRWFCARLKLMEKCRRACRRLFVAVRAIQAAWRRRARKMRAALRLTVTQWDRVWAAKIGAAREPLHPWLVDRACSQLVRETYRRTDAAKSALGRLMLKQSFPVSELFDDHAVRQRQAEVAKLVERDAPGWVVPKEVLHPPAPVEPDFPMMDEASLCGARPLLELVRREVEAKMRRAEAGPPRRGLSERREQTRFGTERRKMALEMRRSRGSR